MLRDYQQTGITKLRFSLGSGNKRVVFYLATGGGKCQKINTPVIMHDGSIKMVQDIVVGDMLLSPTGGARKVLALSRGRGEMFRVTPIRSGDPYYVNANHVLSLRTTTGGRRITLADGRKVQLDGGIVNIDVLTYLASSKSARHCLKGWRPGAVEFGGEPGFMPIKPYILGAWLGDGTSTSPAITKAPSKMMDEWVEFIESTGTGHRAVAGGGCTTVIATNGNRNAGRKENAVTGLLKSLGLLNNKHIPAQYKTASVADRLELIAGLIDSDGHMHHNGYDWISVRKQMAEDFAFVVRSVGLSCHIAECTKGIRSSGFTGTYWRCHVSGDTDKIPCRDKPSTARRQKKRSLVHGITVEPVGLDDYYGFELDGDHLYLLGDFTVTHNSVVSVSIVQAALAKGKRVAFLVNRAGLVHQFSKHLTRAGIRHGILQSTNTHSLDAAVVVGTVQTAARRGLPMVDLAIIDEAHAVPGSKDYRNLIFKFNNIPWIGLTATPFSKGMAKTHDELHGEPLFQDMVVAATIQELIRDGFLVDCEIFAPSEPDLTGVKVQKNAFGEMDYSESDLGMAVDKPDLIGDIVRHWMRLANGKQTVCFATNIAHSKHIVEQFQAAGVKAEHIDGYMDDEERAPIAKRFEDGETTILSNVAVLREGWDVPACEVMILARPTKSLIAWVQMVGRVLRPHPGKTVALVLDHSGTVHNLGYPTDDLPLSLCDGTKSASDSKRKSEEPKDRKCPKCSFIKKTHICPKCGFKPEVKNTIVSEEGELKAVSRANQHEKQVFFSQMLGYAQMKGYKHGFAANQFREKYGEWPRGMMDVPITPSREAMNWVKHRAIAYSKRREK